MQVVERNTGRRAQSVAEGLTPAIPRTIPKWAPIYPGTTPSQVLTERSPAGQVVRFQLSTHAPCGRVIDWYQRQAEAEGFRTFGRSDDQSPRNGCDARISAEGPQGSMKIRAVSYSFSVNISVEALQK